MILKKKIKILFFNFLMKICCRRDLKDERPQGLSWQSALKGYYTIL